MNYLMNACMVLMPLLIIASIWTGDIRWAATAAVAGIPLVIGFLIYARSTRASREDHDR